MDGHQIITKRRTLDTTDCQENRTGSKHDSPRVATEQATAFSNSGADIELDDFKAYVKQRYEAYRLSAVRLLEEIRAQGYTGSIQTLRRFVATLSVPAEAAKKLSVRSSDL